MLYLREQKAPELLSIHSTLVRKGRFEHMLPSVHSLGRRFVFPVMMAVLLLLTMGTNVFASAVGQAAGNTRTGHLAPSVRLRGNNPNYVCCNTGKGYDVLFIHGVYGSGSGVDCNATFTTDIAYLQNHNWVGDLKTLSYYNGDTNCNANMRTTAHASKCNGYPDSSWNLGNNNEDDRHLSCLLAWYIWDNYTVNTWTVDVVAHSLGGVLLKWALFKVKKGDDLTHFPPYLTVHQVVTMASPLGGLPITSGHWFCQCTEISELEFPSGAIYGDLTGQDGRNANDLNNDIIWTMIGQVTVHCNVTDPNTDHVGDSAFQMNYGFKVDYSNPIPHLTNRTRCTTDNINFYYGHGTYLYDDLTALDVTVNFCSGCSGDPSGTVYNYRHSVPETYAGLVGDCKAAPSIDTCDGDDPVETECNNSKYLQSGDPSYIRVYWSTACSTNWAAVDATSGYLKTVTLGRAYSGYSASWCNASASNSNTCWNNGATHLLYCVKGQTGCPALGYAWQYFGPYTKSWYTDMFYAPSSPVQVRVTTNMGASYNSIWH